MLGQLKFLFALGCIKLGMYLLDDETKQTIRDVLMMRVPGAVSEERKAEIRAAWNNYR